MRGVDDGAGEDVARHHVLAQRVVQLSEPASDATAVEADPDDEYAMNKTRCICTLYWAARQNASKAKAKRKLIVSKFCCSSDRIISGAYMRLIICDCLVIGAFNLRKLSDWTAPITIRICSCFVLKPENAYLGPFKSIMCSR